MIPLVNASPFTLAEHEARCVDLVGLESAHYLIMKYKDVYYCSEDTPCVEMTEQVSIEKRIDATSYRLLSETG